MREKNFLPEKKSGKLHAWNCKFANGGKNREMRKRKTFPLAIALKIKNNYVLCFVSWCVASSSLFIKLTDYIL